MPQIQKATEQSDSVSSPKSETLCPIPIVYSGGDPLYQIEPLIDLCNRLRELGYTIWCYTGFEYEHICQDSSLSRILDKVDVIVDGPYKASLRDIGLRFRGSSNQRLIDTKASSTSGKAIIWSD